MSGVNFESKDILKYSDLAAGAVSALYASIFGEKMNGERVGMAVIVSVLARIISMNLPTNAGGVTDMQTKNQIVVASLNGLSAWMKNRNVPKSILTGVSIDLIAEKLFDYLTITDQPIFGGSSTPAPTPQPTTGP